MLLLHYLSNFLVWSFSHYSVPKLPKLPGIERYGGRQVHSHDYREPISFRGASVLVLGGGASGLDIAIELATEAKEVRQSLGELHFVRLFTYLWIILCLNLYTHCFCVSEHARVWYRYLVRFHEYELMAA